MIHSLQDFLLLGQFDHPPVLFEGSIVYRLRMILIADPGLFYTLPSKAELVLKYYSTPPLPLIQQQILLAKFRVQNDYLLEKIQQSLSPLIYSDVFRFSIVSFKHDNEIHIYTVGYQYKPLGAVLLPLTFFWNCIYFLRKSYHHEMRIILSFWDFRLGPFDTSFQFKSQMTLSHASCASQVWPSQKVESTCGIAECGISNGLSRICGCYVIGSSECGLCSR